MELSVLVSGKWEADSGNQLGILSKEIIVKHFKKLLCTEINEELFVVILLFSVLMADEWFAQLDCQDDAIIHSPTSCGKNPGSPCCHLLDVINSIQEGDTVYITQRPPRKHPQCNHRKVLQVGVPEAFTLKTAPLSGSVKQGSFDGIHGIHLVFNNNCSESCSIMINKGHFTCSSIKINNMDIRIQNSTFRSSFLTFQHQPGIPSPSHSIKIKDTEFQTNIIKYADKKHTDWIYTGPCKQLNFICVRGDWDSVEVVRSTLKGDITSHASGIEVMHANVQMLNLIGVHISFLSSALVIDSLSSLESFNVRESIFVSNRDGIDVGQGVRYAVITCVQMNDTGAWLVQQKVKKQYGFDGGSENVGTVEPDSNTSNEGLVVEHYRQSSGDVGLHYNPCTSAIRGNVQTLIIHDSLFANNQAFGWNCKGAALSLTGFKIEQHFPNRTLLEPGNKLTPSIEIIKSIFSGNVNGNCSLKDDSWNVGGGATTVLGSHMLIKVKDSTFWKNTACKGAGLYISLSGNRLLGNDRKTMSDSKVSSKIVIESCTFNENVVDYGGGLMIGFTEFTLDANSSLSTAIYKSSFHANLAHYRGSGAYISYESMTAILGGSIIINIHDNDFFNNTCKDTDDYFTFPQGGALNLKFTSFSLRTHSSVRMQISMCSFNSNKADLGGGLLFWVESCTLNVNSFFTLHVTNSNFTSNIAREYYGGGIYTNAHACSLDSNSSFMFHVSYSNFTSNVAGDGDGGGIHSRVWNSTLQSHSSITLLTSACKFTSNEGYYGAGVSRVLSLCSLNSNSAFTVQESDSTFVANTAGFGAGISTEMWSSSLQSNSSFILHTSGSTFTSNVAAIGAGIYTHVMNFSLSSNSLFTLLTSNSIFTSNTARRTGSQITVYESNTEIQHNTCWEQDVTNCTFLHNVVGLNGLDLWVIRFNIHGLHQTIVNGCTFMNNTAEEQGASLSVKHDSEAGLVSGKIVVTVVDCLFLGNTASMEGGAGYFRVISQTQVSVKFSHFERNRALAGSGLYIENVEVTSYNKSQCESNSQVLSTTLVENCSFHDNIDTAIVITSQLREGICKIIKSSFKNNWCIQSLFAEDIFTNMDLVLEDIKIWKDKKHLDVMSINSLSDTWVKCVTMTITGQAVHRQIRVASFSHYITSNISSQFKYQCPEFYKPILSTAGLSESGALTVQATCDACMEGYYKGHIRLAIQAELEEHQLCYSKKLKNLQGIIIGHNEFCHTATTGVCIACPQGANCSAGVVALPNYWGHMTADDKLEFLRCPVGYCCNQAPCEGIDQCAAHREGTLCGRCMKGFSESLITSQCILDDGCNDWWVFPLFCLWGFNITLVIVFSQDIQLIMKNIQTRLKGKMGKAKRENKEKAMDTESGETELQRKRSIDMLPSDSSQSVGSNSELDGTEFKNMQSIEVQTAQSTVKVLILWGLLTIEREENVEASGSHKYIQIMLYYLQDASLIQVDLALVSTIVTPTQRLRQLLLNISQLAVNLIDLGLNLCPIPGWTPVSKLLLKNLTGLFVFCYIFAIYGIVRVVCRCFPGKKKMMVAKWYPRLTAAAIFSILLFYQQIANVAFLLLYCIKSDDQTILFIDGTVTCYQPWQILFFIFAFNWVVGIIPVLAFLPGLLELRLISVSHFFLTCLMPGPMLLYWLLKLYRKKLKVPMSEDKKTPWHEEALRILQKTFVKTTDKNGLPLCWVGCMKVRRLALVLLFTFVSNLVARVSLMCLVIVLFLLFHLETKPYQDHLANGIYTASLLATLAIGFVNLMKAACVEFYLDLDKVAHFLNTLNMITDGILVYFPLGFIGFTVTVVLAGQVRGLVCRKREKQN